MSYGPNGFSPNKKRSRRSGITGTLRLGTEPTASTTQALPVAAFCAAHPLAKVHVDSRLSTTELSRQLLDFELDAVIAHFAPEDRAGLRVVPLYEERYILLAPDDQLMPQGHTMKWADAAQLPLALLTPDMRIRRVIDGAFAESGVAVTPQVETDSVASLYAQVASERGRASRRIPVARDAGGRQYKSHPTG